jgi:hypothetical protein
MAILFVALGMAMVFRTGNLHPMRSATWVKANPRDISGHRARVGGAVLLEHRVTIAAMVTVARLATNHGGNKMVSIERYEVHPRRLLNEINDKMFGGDR